MAARSRVVAARSRDTRERSHETRERSQVTRERSRVEAARSRVVRERSHPTREGAHVAAALPRLKRAPPRGVGALVGGARAWRVDVRKLAFVVLECGAFGVEYAGGEGRMAEDWKNKLFFGDNLSILRSSVATESVDLIYLDPPFNSAANYNVLFKEQSGQQSAAQITAFEDTWHWSPEAEMAFHDLRDYAPEDLLNLMTAMRGFWAEHV